MIQNEELPQQLKISAAGSLRHVLPLITELWHKQSSMLIETRFGPAGLLYKNILAGQKADLFLSANQGWPCALAEEGLAGAPIHFTDNLLCCTVLKESSITSETLIETLKRRDIKIGISTPQADPGGDYALKIFQNMEKLEHGAYDRLFAQSRMLVGGTLETTQLSSGPGIMIEALLSGKIDITIGYFSNAARAAAQISEIRIVTLPAQLAVTAAYYLNVLKSAHPQTESFVKLLLSADGRTIFHNNNFLAG